MGYLLISKGEDNKIIWKWMLYLRDLVECIWVLFNFYIGYWIFFFDFDDEIDDDYGDYYICLFCGEFYLGFLFLDEEEEDYFEY